MTPFFWLVRPVLLLIVYLVDTRYPWIARPVWRDDVEPDYDNNAAEMLAALEYGVEL